jgi:GxxExxY protein
MENCDITGRIIKAAIEVHRALGPGLLEKVYTECLFYTLKKMGLVVEKEKEMPVFYDGLSFDFGYRLDLLVENSVVVELKSVKKLDDVHLAQILTYMKLGNYQLGLLINFNVAKLRDGIKRVVYGLEE